MADAAYERPDTTSRAWRISATAILIVGLVLRLYNLNLVPLHHDEGVNGNFLLHLIRFGDYKYDPQNYHGPTLYYFAAVIPWISRFLFGAARGDAYGLNNVTIRFVTAMFGIGTVWLVLTLRRRIGTIASLAAAVFLAISPGAVYLSRYFIHETLLVFFTLGLIIAAIRFYETARTVYLMLAATACALMFATKETAFISAGVLLIAFASTAVLFKLRAANKKEERKAGGEDPPTQGRLHRATERFGGALSIAIVSIAAVSLFLAIDILFYSSFFTNYPQGPFDALKAFQFWTRTGEFEHVHPWWTFLSWMWKEESPLLLLGAVGMGLAFWRSANRFAIFSALWAFGLFAAYSLIPYKTPWLMLNFIVPLAIVAGYAFEEIYKQARAKQRRIALMVAVTIATAVIGICSYQMAKLNFVHYDDDRYVYSYVHTHRDIFPMLDEIDRLSKRAGTGNHTKIHFAAREYWPLPWYLRNYPEVLFGGPIDSFNEPIIIAAVEQEPEIEATLGKSYQLVKSNLNAKGTYSLRPGVDLLIFARNELGSR